MTYNLRNIGFRNKDYVLERIKKDPSQIVHTKVHLDYDFLLQCVQVEPSILYYLDEKYWDDCQIVHAAVTQNPHCLMDASDRLRNHPGIVIAAVKKTVLHWMMQANKCKMYMKLA